MRGLDPRARLLITLLIFGVPLCLQSPLWLLLPLLLVSTALLRSGGGRIMRNLLPLLAVIVLASVLLWPLFVPGQPIGIGWLTDNGLRFGLGMGLRLCIFSFMGSLYILTSPVEEIAWALHRLGLPYVMSFGMVMAFRLMEQLGRTTATVLAAQRARGVGTQGGLLARWHSYIPLLVPILVLSLRRVDGLAMAMESRGFQPRGRRTTLLQFRMTRRDALAIMTAAAALGLALWLRLHGYGVLVAGRI